MQFALRGMLMMWLPTRFTLGAFMHWLGFEDGPDDPTGRRTRAIDLTYLGLKHCRFSRATARRRC